MINVNIHRFGSLSTVIVNCMLIIENGCMRQWKAVAPLSQFRKGLDTTCREGRCAWKLGVKGFGSSPAEAGPKCARELLPSLSPGVSGERHLLVANLMRVFCASQQRDCWHSISNRYTTSDQDGISRLLCRMKSCAHTWLAGSLQKRHVGA